jgi:hypothetical protein
MASIWFNGSYHTTKEPDRSEATMGDDTWRRWERCELTKGSLRIM